MAFLSGNLIVFLLDVVMMAITNVKNHPELRARIQDFGFTDERLNEGEQLYATAETFYTLNETQSAKQHQQGEVVNEKFKEVQKFYMKYVKLVRKRLKRDEKALEVLGLRGKRATMAIKYIEQVKLFLANVIKDQDIFDRVSDLGITPEKMQEGFTLIDAWNAENAKHEELKSDTQGTTVDKHEAFSRVNDWWGEFRQALLNSTEDKPQLLERVRIPAYSPEYLRKKRAKAKAEAAAKAAAQAAAQAAEDGTGTEEPQIPEPVVQEQPTGGTPAAGS